MGKLNKQLDKLASTVVFANSLYEFLQDTTRKVLSKEISINEYEKRIDSMPADFWTWEKSDLNKLKDKSYIVARIIENERNEYGTSRKEIIQAFKDVKKTKKAKK